MIERDNLKFTIPLEDAPLLSIFLAQVSSVFHELAFLANNIDFMYYPDASSRRCQTWLDSDALSENTVATVLNCKKLDFGTIVAGFRTQTTQLDASTTKFLIKDPRFWKKVHRPLLLTHAIRLRDLSLISLVLMQTEPEKDHEDGIEAYSKSTPIKRFGGYMREAMLTEDPRVAALLLLDDRIGFGTEGYNPIDALRVGSSYLDKPDKRVGMLYTLLNSPKVKKKHVSGINLELNKTSPLLIRITAHSVRKNTLCSSGSLRNVFIINEHAVRGGISLYITI